ncbi:MAG TPA: type II toxin-antitoxin system VapC family toxin [Pirellulales bacterium]|nr:type II toxin-antitoxin system VapC family toxin [Pirellulales bacterium]
MSAAFVIDCSVAMTWLFEDEQTPQTVKLLGRLAEEPALVPDWWFLEVANVLAIAERKGRVTITQSAEFIAEMSKLAIEVDVDGPGRAFSDLLPLCRAHQLTSYDAVYLDLAVRRKLPLATLDERLRKAAPKLGVKLLGR